MPNGSAYSVVLHDNCKVNLIGGVQIKDNGHTHTKAWGQIPAQSLVIIPSLQRAHGNGNPGAQRAAKLAADFDPAKVLVIDVAIVTLPEDTLAIIMGAGQDPTINVVTIPAGTVVAHTADGATRLQAAWLWMAETGATFTFSVVSYHWANKIPADELKSVLASHFLNKNGVTSVGRADKLKLRALMGEADALDIIEVVHDLDLYLPHDVQELMLTDVSGARKIKRDADVVTPVGQLINMYFYYGVGMNQADARVKEHREAVLSDDHDGTFREAARDGLHDLLVTADYLFPSGLLRGYQMPAGVKRLDDNNRWNGDYLYGLALVLAANPQYIDHLCGTAPISPRSQDAELNRWRRASAAGSGGTYGPSGWQAQAQILAGQMGQGTLTSEDGRAYWIARAIVGSVNGQRRTGKLALPQPPAGVAKAAQAFAEVVGLTTQQMDESDD